MVRPVMRAADARREESMSACRREGMVAEAGAAAGRKRGGQRRSLWPCQSRCINTRACNGQPLAEVRVEPNT